MAPEQVKGFRGDPRCDIYSLGVMLFRVSTGTFPYTNEPRSRQAWLKTKEQVARTVAGHGLLATAGLGHIIGKAMACDTQARYQWVEDMRDDFMDSYR
jgi:serine/threonine-protein kinase